MTGVVFLLFIVARHAEGQVKLKPGIGDHFEMGSDIPNWPDSLRTSIPEMLRYSDAANDSISDYFAVYERAMKATEVDPGIAVFHYDIPDSAMVKWAPEIRDPEMIVPREHVLRGQGKQGPSPYGK